MIVIYACDSYCYSYHDFGLEHALSIDLLTQPLVSVHWQYFRGVTCMDRDAQRAEVCHRQWYAA